MVIKKEELRFRVMDHTKKINQIKKVGFLL